MTNINNPMKLAIIANGLPRAKNKKQLADIENRLKNDQIDCEIHMATHHNHAIEIAMGLPVKHYDAIASLGGDGTNFQMLNGLLSANDPASLPPLAILPSGRGNSFAKDLGIETMEDGLSALARRSPRAVDVCRFTQGEASHYFVNLMGLGFVTDVAKTAEHFRWAGDASYVAGVIYRAMTLSFHWMELEIDGKIMRGKNCFVEICNSTRTGGNMIMAPSAKIDDGFFDVVVGGPVSRGSLLGTLPKIFKGTHGENPAITFHRGKSLKIRTKPAKQLLPDGEVFGFTPAEVDIMPGLVRYFS